MRRLVERLGGSGEDAVVPLAVPVVRLYGQGGEFGVGDFLAEGVVALVEVGLDFQAGPGGGGGDQLDDDPVGGEGSLPRQFSVMKLKRRCSILFHLEVPGGM